MKITLRFYEELNDFIPPGKRKQQFVVELNGKTTVKDVIESQGIPHTEVDLILVNGESVSFDHQPLDGDKISVYPVFESLDISPISKLRPQPLRDTKFILDVHLGKLARKLRMMGFDTLYRNDFDDDEIIHIACKEKRIILTRDIGILKQKSVTHGYFVRSTQAHQQLTEILDRFDLNNKLQPLSRCINCNGTIIPVSKDKIAHLLLPKTKTYFSEFFQCTGCGKVYWEGSHYERMLQHVETMIK
ncbi:MAG: Mut7-C ubiquitin/RNAse domain-containing protein [Bacteroidetes bacterium]|nr:Mut7-C ubiquitin/RNAse domain-containing protein [Bacteroidota bacterium]